MIRNRIFCLLATFICSMPTLNAENKKELTKATATEKTSQIIDLEAKLVDGKKTWTPIAVSALPGKVIFRLTNSFPEPHGFNITDVMKDPLVVPANTTIEVPIEFSKPGSFDLMCHIHPAHVKSVLTVK